jgi:hypothetical protein
MRNVRNNERAQFEAPSWIALLWERLAALPLPHLDGEAAVGLPKELRFYKYSPGQRFKVHKGVLDRGRDDQPADAGALPDHRFDGAVASGDVPVLV